MNNYQIGLIIFVAITNVIGIGLVFIDWKFNGDALEVSDLFKAFWVWCIYLVLAFCAFFYLNGVNNQLLSNCLQNAQNNFDTSLAGKEKVQPDGSYGASVSDRIQVDQSYLQEQANCKILYK